MPAKKDNAIMTFLKGLTPANLILVVIIISGFVLNEAVFKANTENILQNQETRIEEQVMPQLEERKMEIKQVSKRVETNKDGVKENKHRSELILQKQEMILEKMQEIKVDIQRIPKRRPR